MQPNLGLLKSLNSKKRVLKLSQIWESLISFRVAGCLNCGDDLSGLEGGGHGHFYKAPQMTPLRSQELRFNGLSIHLTEFLVSISPWTRHCTEGNTEEKWKERSIGVRFPRERAGAWAQEQAPWPQEGNHVGGRDWDVQSFSYFLLCLRVTSVEAKEVSEHGLVCCTLFYKKSESLSFLSDLLACSSYLHLSPLLSEGYHLERGWAIFGPHAPKQQLGLAEKLETGKPQPVLSLNKLRIFPFSSWFPDFLLSFLTLLTGIKTHWSFLGVFAALADCRTSGKTVSSTL